MASLAAPKAAKATPEEALAAAEAKVAALEAEVAALEAALAASPEDGGVKKSLKKLKKKLGGAQKGVKKAQKGCKGNQWDSKAAGQGENAKRKKAAKAAKAKAAAAKAAEQAAWVNPTASGAKKDVSGEIAREYFPERVEAAWGEWWEASGLFSPDAQEALRKPESERFTIVIPPPNVTGSLHIGHALTCAIEDAIVRWHRMQGKSVLWLPGTDHAGIATQTQVEKLLMKETGQTRHDLGREAFLEKVWEWKRIKGGRITQQLRKLGASVDWSREVFTMDEKLGIAVTEAFVRMYDQGHIYRKKRLVNWCSKLNTAISDIEVDHEALKGRTLKKKCPGHDLEHEYEFGVIISFAYKVANDDGSPSDEEIVVATTRLETMLGDTGVAVHPDDPRYTHLHGKRLVHPFRGDDHPHKTIPLVLDDILVDMAFGTGAVKITPAHDPNDYECGKRNSLEEIDILDDNGAINEAGAPFAGIMRFDAREQIRTKLDAMGLYRGVANNPMELPVCSRSGDIVEPRLKPQWFVNTEAMAATAFESVKSGELKIVPEMHKETWYKWLGNIRHWCISRQLWWGHRIPAYLVNKNGAPPANSSNPDNWVVARSEAEAMAKAVEKTGMPAESLTLSQDPDVLDTWFSSGLFPFSTMGWPDNESPDLNAFFPGSLLETGSDILFFWVARMVMMSQTLTGKLPFHTVYLHSMVRDKYGTKMSKSKGNVIDPMDVIEGASLQHLVDTLEKSLLPKKEIVKNVAANKKLYPKGIERCGADALRFGLLMENRLQGRDVNLDISRVLGYRKFCNKLWNLHRLGNFFGMDGPSFVAPVSIDALLALELSAADRWILSRLHQLCIACNAAFEAYDFATACSRLYEFLLKEFAQIYAELAKPMIRGDAAGPKQAGMATFYTCLEVSYRLIHPMMPYISEELWQRLPRSASGGESKESGSEIVSIALAAYPNPAKNDQLSKLSNKKIEGEMGEVVKALDGLNSLRGTFLKGKKVQPNVFIVVTGDNGGIEAALNSNRISLQKMCDTGEVVIRASAEALPEGCASKICSDVVTVYMMLKGVVNFAEEIPRMEKKAVGLAARQAKLQAQLDDPERMAKATQESKFKTEKDLADAGAFLKELNEQIAMFKAMA